MQKDWKKACPSEWNRAEGILKNDGVVVLPTDTLYGVIGNVLSKKAVKRIYKIKGRNENKPFIVLINSYKQLEIFGIKLGKNEIKVLEKFWPGKVSVILPCKLSKWKYIHRGVNSIAFRMIGKKNKKLFNLIEKVGPVVAPSANTEGKMPARNITEAKRYFNDNVDLYISLGTRISKPSKIIKYENGELVIIRK